MNQKYIKKFIASVLLVTMIFPMLPVEMVLASAHPPNDHLVLVDNPSEKDYNVNLEWNVVDYVMDNYDVSPRRNHYDLFLWNTTTQGVTRPKQPFDSYPQDGGGVQVVGRTVSKNLSELKLESGSFYKFSVLPFHYEWARDGSGTHLKSYNTFPRVSKEILYLTELELETRGDLVYDDDDNLLGQLTLEWDNPTIGGQEIFSGYDIYYLRNGDASNVMSGSRVRVNSDDENLVRTGRKFRYVIKPGIENPLVPMAPYAIKVVPVYKDEFGAETQINGFMSKEIVLNGKTIMMYNSSKDNTQSEVMIAPRLSLKREGKSEIVLSWTGKNTQELEITHVTLYQSPYEDMSASTIVISVPQPPEVKGSERLQRPTSVTYYVAEYEYILNGVKGIIRTNIVKYIPEIEDFDPTAPTILQVDHDYDPVTMDITFEAFVRQLHKEENIANIASEDILGNNYIVDRNVVYDLYITDDYSNFKDPTFQPFTVMPEIDAKTLGQHFDYIRDGNYTNRAYKLEGITEYATKDAESGGYIFKELEENKVYYIRMYARRTPNHEKSEYSEYAHYIDSFGDILTRPIMMARPPLRVKMDENNMPIITKNSIAIEWDTDWFEIYNYEDKKWYSKVDRDSSGNLIFGKDDINSTPIIPSDKYVVTENKTSQDIINEIKQELPPQYAVRYMNLGGLNNTKYELHVVDYETIQNYVGGYDAYYESIKDDEEGIQWTTPIDPEGAGRTLWYDVKTSNVPGGTLSPDTNYAILLRPYKEKNGGRAYFPAYIVERTLGDIDDLDIKPIVPLIEAVSSTDMSVTIKFQYKENLQYQLFYSDYLFDYPEKGTMIKHEDLMEKGKKIKGPNNETWIEFTIENLFPETLYHVWIRSYVENSKGTKYSDYSGAVSQKTKELPEQGPPEGLGVADSKHVDTYNRENSTDFLPRDVDYIIIEWYRDMKDVDQDYINTGSSTGDAQALISPNILNSYMAKFNNLDDLVSNRPYYFRAKTIRTVTKTANGVKSYFQYVVQMSVYEDFMDYVELTIPNIPAVDPVYTIVKESEFCDPVKIHTTRGDNEYDGENSAETYPLPKQDFEIIYDEDSDTLVYRFRSNEIDEAGNRDNHVDQRFISDLVASKAYNVSIDVTSYEGKSVKNKVIEMPYSITNALTERQINLIVKSSDISFTYPPGFVENNEVNNLSDFGTNSKIKIFINDISTENDLPDTKGYYATDPQKMGISVETPSKTIALNETKVPYTVDCKISNRNLLLDKNITGNVFGKNDSDWVRVDNQSYNKETAKVTYDAQKLGTHSVIAKDLPKTSYGDGGTTPAMQNVSRLVEIKDMVIYDPNAQVNSNQLNKLLYTIAKDGRSVHLNAPLTQQEEDALAKSGMIVYGVGSVSREMAINSFVRLYEIKTKETISSYGDVATTPYKDIQAANQIYQVSLLKAAKLGYFEDVSARPKEYITIEEMLDFADIIIQDAGLL